MGARFLIVAAAAFLVIVVGSAHAKVLTSEFSSFPESEGWTLSGNWGERTTWVAYGVYYQEFSITCGPEDGVCASEAFTRSIDIFNKKPKWFYEYRVSATGDQNEIEVGAPTVLSAFNSFGNVYHATVASDMIKLKGDADLPIFFHEVGGGPHVIRLELFNEPAPATYHWYVDAELVFEGLADSPFPDFDAQITWQGRNWMQPTLNSWDYIRAGDIPEDASGNFNSDHHVDETDAWYVAECIERSASGEPADPSCTWADMDADNTVDCLDWDIIKATVWTSSNDPPPIAACGEGAVPTTSEWGLLIMLGLLATSGTLVFRQMCYA